MIMDYSLGNRRRKESGASVECYWQGALELLGECPLPMKFYSPQTPNPTWEFTGTEPEPPIWEGGGKQPEPLHRTEGTQVCYKWKCTYI